MATSIESIRKLMGSVGGGQKTTPEIVKTAQNGSGTNDDATIVALSKVASPKSDTPPIQPILPTEKSAGPDPSLSTGSSNYTKMANFAESAANAALEATKKLFG